MLCFVIKKVEVKKLGAIIKLLITKTTEQRAAIVFIDDMNFYSNGQKYNKKIQSTLDTYMKLYEATRGSIQYDKNYIYRQKQQNRRGKLSIIDIEVNIQIYNKKIKQYQVSETFRTLGVYMNPELKWND